MPTQGEADPLGSGESRPPWPEFLTPGPKGGPADEEQPETLAVGGPFSIPVGPVRLTPAGEHQAEIHALEARRIDPVFKA